MNELLDIPELINLSVGRGIVRIPVELDVPFTPRVKALVDTPEFQRLRRISQLGLVSRVYPGATHTRFEHALGVFHHTLKYLLHLSKDERFRGVMDRKSVELVMVSGLLHDLGHWPFCHPIEDMKLAGLPEHEEFAGRFLLGETELAQVLKTEWGIEPRDVLDVLVKKSDTPRMRLIRSLISGPIDVDKMDYLDRDSLHCGVPYGRNYDRSRLIESLVLNEAGDGLALSVKGKTAAELMVFARYVMFSEVYWHHAVRSATSMFARAFFELFDKLHLGDFFVGDEAECIAMLRDAAEGTDAAVLVEGLFGNQRVLYKRLAEFSSDQHPEEYERLAHRPFEQNVLNARELVETLNRECGLQLSKMAILIDAPPVHREVEFKIDLYDAREKNYRHLSDASPVVDALAKKQFDSYVKKVRVFCHPDVKMVLSSEQVRHVLTGFLRGQR